jgi:cytochrome oxidase Cu insertion factor (SCO1/SenC/PrrC family)
MTFQELLPSRFHRYFAVAVVALAVVLGGVAIYFSKTGGQSGSGVALVGGPFELTDQDGRQVTEKDLLGKHALVFFGFTYCPDVCPTELQVITASLQQMGSKADQLRPIFITVDPARDTPKAMRDYLANFDPRFWGLTGTDAQIAQVARAYRVYYARVDNKQDPQSYLMDHSSLIYLMGPDGRFLKHFPYTTDAAGLAKEIESAMSGGSS